MQLPSPLQTSAVRSRSQACHSHGGHGSRSAHERQRMQACLESALIVLPPRRRPPVQAALAFSRHRRCQPAAGKAGRGPGPGGVGNHLDAGVEAADIGRRVDRATRRVAVDRHVVVEPVIATGESCASGLGDVRSSGTARHSRCRQRGGRPLTEAPPSCSLLGRLWGAESQPA